MSILRKKLIGRKNGFTLIELLMVVAIIGILSAIAMPIYASMQAKARTGKAQSDVATIAEAFSAFAAHCGDVPGDAADLTGAGGGKDCATAIGGTGVTPLTTAVTDANGISSGPWFSPEAIKANGSLTPPQDWTYSFKRNGTADFTVTATASDGKTKISRP